MLRVKGSYFLYATTIFLSAFLLFAIEPMAGKHLLPYFGGSSSVWATSLLFFTLMLFLGYAYVYCIAKLSTRRQVAVHATLVAIAVVAAVLAVAHWHSIYPPLTWIVSSDQMPATELLFALFVAVGAPYFVLSTTGPLLQYWYGLASSEEPYRLYALSNAGSFLALIAYPFLIEPSITLHVQEALWIAAFVLYALLAFSVVHSFWRSRPVVVSAPQSSERISHLRSFEWISLAALPAFMLVATTTVITQAIAPVPLLWVVPLAVYLLTFVFAFAGWGQGNLLPFLTLCAIVAAYTHLPYAVRDATADVVSYLALLFFCGWYCHATLYRLRPQTAHLPYFYLLVSFGGMLGTLAIALAAPFLFSDFLEFPLGLAILAALVLVRLPLSYFPRIVHEDRAKLAKIVSLFVVMVLFTDLALRDNGIPHVDSRNFFGVVHVDFNGVATVLMHGSTMHGLQPDDRSLRFVPTAYYVASSGVGRAMLYEQSLRGEAGIRAAVIGLGAGTISTYCRDRDVFVFYEIDPRIENLARSYFSYLAHCKAAEVRINDARVTLQRELDAGERGNYDLVAMDAFADDTVPAHLVTEQAIALYFAHARSAQSIVAVHISNRYLDLAPVMLKIATKLSLNAMVITDNGASSPTGSPSQWVLFAKDAKVFSATVFANSSSTLPSVSAVRSAPLWTDDYTSLWSVVNLPKLF